MRTSGWMKRQPWYWPVKVFLKRLVGREIRLKAEVKLDTTKVAEWTFIGEMLNAGSVIYSIGSGNDIDFDLHLIDRYGATVYAFDPTPFASGWLVRTCQMNLFSNRGLRRARTERCGFIAS